MLINKEQGIFIYLIYFVIIFDISFCVKVIKLNLLFTTLTSPLLILAVLRREYLINNIYEYNDDK